MDNSRQRTFLEYALSVFVFGIIWIYAFGYSLAVSYPGFDFSIENSTVTRVIATDKTSQKLLPGDKLLQLNAAPIEAYIDTLGQPIFAGVLQI